MELSKQQKQLLEFVKEKHKDQVRKYTGEPYYTHLLNVAEICSKYKVGMYMSIEIALCHDLMEDTDCKENELYLKLIELGYSSDNWHDILYCVRELTDEFTPDKYPNLSRFHRKMNEAYRLSETCSLTQSVKYADIIDNLSTIVKHDPKFAKIYTKEKETYLRFMKKGNFKLYLLACYTLVDAMNKLKINL